MFIELFTLAVVAALPGQHPVEAGLYPVNDTCANFPVEQVNGVIKEFFKNVSAIRIFAMTTDWSACTARAGVFGESLSHTFFDSLDSYNSNQHLNVDGILLTATQEVKFSISDHMVNRRDFETLAMIIMKGDDDQNLGTLRSSSKLFHRSVILNIDQRNELTGCILDSESNNKCFRDTELFKMDQHVQVPEHFSKRDKGTLKVTLFRLETDEQPETDFFYRNPLVRLVDRPVLQAMTSMLNLTPVSVGDHRNFGYRLPNGTFVGDYGDIEYGRADLANSRMVTFLQGAENIRFLYPIMVTPFKFIVPKNYYEHPRREVDVIGLSPQFVVAYYSILLWFPLGFQLFEYYDRKINPEMYASRNTRDSAIFATLAVMINVSIAIRDVSSQRIYWMSLIWFQLIAYSVFQGNMIKEVNRADSSRDIQTVQELIESNLDIKMHYAMEDFIQFDEKTMKTYNLSSRIILNNDEPVILISKLIPKGSYAILLPQHMVDDLVPRFYDERTGEDLVHVIPEVVSEFHCAMYVPANSPYMEPFNRILMIMVESGLINYGLKYRLFEASLAYIERYKSRNFAQPEKYVATVDFVALKRNIFAFVGMSVVALLVFCVEGFAKRICMNFKRLKLKVLSRTKTKCVATKTVRTKFSE